MVTSYVFKGKVKTKPQATQHKLSFNLGELLLDILADSGKDLIQKTNF